MVLKGIFGFEYGIVQVLLGFDIFGLEFVVVVVNVGGIGFF